MNTTSIHGLARTVREMFIQRIFDVHRVIREAESTGWLPRMYGSMEDHSSDFSVDLTICVIGLVQNTAMEPVSCRHCLTPICASTADAEWMHVTESPDGAIIDRLRLDDCPHCMQQIDQEWELIDGLWKSRPF
jgi:hypothetical protein